jgi:hypothetical protein
MKERGREAAAAALVAIAGVGPHVVAIDGEFLNWDDDRFIRGNPLFSGPVREYVLAAFDRIQFDAYHPLHLLSYLPDRLLWPTWAPGFHILSLASFAAVIALFYLLVRRIVGRETAVWSSLLFACHPLVVEPVAWISDRKDLLAMGLALAVLYVEDHEPRRANRILAFCLTVAAYLAKTSTVVLPGLVFAWFRWVRGESPRAALRRAAPSAVPALVVDATVLRIWTSHHMIAGARPLPAVWDVSGTLGFYLGRTLIPVRLSALYPSIAPSQILLGATFLAAGLATAVWWRHLPALARFALVSTVLALLPVSNLVPLYFRFGDRYQFLALAMAILGASHFVERLLAGRTAVITRIVLGTSIVAGGLASTDLARTWRTSLALWSHATSAQPRAFFAWLKLGETQRALGEWSRATASYSRAVELEPRSLLGFGGLFLSLGGRAEMERKIAPGTTTIWTAELGSAARDPDHLQAFISKVGAAGCTECAYALLWMSLRMYPRDDQVLEALARRSLDAGQVGAALIFVREMKDKSSAAYRSLSALVRSADPNRRFSPRQHGLP